MGTWVSGMVGFFMNLNYGQVVNFYGLMQKFNTDYSNNNMNQNQYNQAVSQLIIQGVMQFSAFGNIPGVTLVSLMKGIVPDEMITLFSQIFAGVSIGQGGLMLIGMVMTFIWSPNDMGSVAQSYVQTYLYLNTTSMVWQLFRWYTGTL